MKPITHPTALGGYRIEAVLARGARSIVYLAQDPYASHRVALKTRPVSLGGYGREFALADALPHPHIIGALGHGVDGQVAFLAMEYAAGASLANRGPLAPARVFSLVVQAAIGLDRVHRRGWVHRDVKPANMLLRADGSLALADFGSLCGQGDADSPRSRVAGTPVYCAPEQCAGEPAAPAADVYSLGAALHELLCGRPPFPGQTPTELLCQHLLAPVPVLPAAHGAWQPLLEAMLAKEPGRRLADGEAVLEKLRQAGHFLVQPCRPGSRDSVEEST